MNIMKFIFVISILTCLAHQTLGAYDVHLDDVLPPLDSKDFIFTLKNPDGDGTLEAYKNLTGATFTVRYLERDLVDRGLEKGQLCEKSDSESLEFMRKAILKIFRVDACPIEAGIYEITADFTEDSNALRSVYDESFNNAIENIEIRLADNDQNQYPDLYMVFDIYTTDD